MADLTVWQSVSNLRDEQKVFSAAARLIAELQTEKPNADQIFKFYSHFPESEEKGLFDSLVERLLRRRGTSLLTATCQRAQVGLCKLLNRFPSSLEFTESGPVELPTDESKMLRGIQSALYYFLRLEYQQRGRIGLGLCRQCHEVFAKERRGAVFCSPGCSGRFRSKVDYDERGRDRRRKKRASLKSLSRAGTLLGTSSTNREALRLKLSSPYVFIYPEVH